MPIKHKPKTKEDDDSGVRCPSCKSKFSIVIYRREMKKGFQRRRECVHCGRRFSTFETS